MKELNISKERKAEIDAILRESEERYKRGEIKSMPLNEFLEMQEKRRAQRDRIAPFLEKKMILAISDIHGNLSALKKIWDCIKPLIKYGRSKLIMLGDYIDRGHESYECLQMAHDLQQEYGKDKVIVLKGNHEAWFMDFIAGNGDDWLAEDEGYKTTKTFLAEEQMKELSDLYHREEKLDYMKQTIRNNHKELLTWVNQLPLFYETDKQIFVHAGVDEDIPEEELEWCTLGTGEWTFLGKYPPSKGKFYKDIIAGHVAAKQVAGDRGHQGIYFDGESHFYIDGSGGDRTSLLCLAYDEEEDTYYDLKSDGTYKRLK